MKLRYLMVAALVGGSVSLGWGFVAHMTGVFPALEPKSFADSTLVVQTVRANAPANGVYVDGRGLFAAVSFRSDLSSKSDDMIHPLIHQFIIEVAVALLLAWVLLRLPVWSAWGTGSLFATVGLAAGIGGLFSQANWYGFPIRFQLATLAYVVVGWFLLGLVIGWLRKKMMGETA